MLGAVRATVGLLLLTWLAGCALPRSAAPRGDWFPGKPP